MRNIGARLLEQRELKEVSQKELSEILGVKQNTISQYENNIRRPSYEVLIQFAKYFGVTTDYLLGLED